MTIKSNDLGNFSTLEGCRKIKIDDLVRKVNKDLKKTYLEAEIRVFSQEVEVCTTRTRFGGRRFWFLCPHCKTRRGVLYQHPLDKQVLCRTCLGLIYKKQRYKGMIEVEDL